MSADSASRGLTVNACLLVSGYQSLVPPWLRGNTELAEYYRFHEFRLQGGILTQPRVNGIGFVGDSAVAVFVYGVRSRIADSSNRVRRHLRRCAAAIDRGTNATRLSSQLVLFKFAGGRPKLQSDAAIIQVALRAHIQYETQEPALLTIYDHRVGHSANGLLWGIFVRRGGNQGGFEYQ